VHPPENWKLGSCCLGRYRTLGEYSLFIDELFAGSLMQSKTFAALDIGRLAALFFGTCFVALVAYRLSIRTAVPSVGGSNVDA
jgi:hypothetical protein